MVDKAFKNKGYDEIDLIELIKILWKNKKKIFYITFASAIISVFYSLIYQISIKPKHFILHQKMTVVVVSLAWQGS